MELILGLQLEKNDWKTANKKPVKNKELWVELDQLVQKHKFHGIGLRSLRGSR